MQAVVHADRQEQHGDGIHGGVEGHVEPCELQPSGQSVGGSNGDDGQHEDVGGFSHASEIKPQNNAQEHHGGTGQHSDFLSNGSTGIFCELSEREGAEAFVSGCGDDGGFHGLGPFRQIGLDVSKNFIAEINGFARHRQGHQHRSIAVPRVGGVIGGQA